MQTIWKVLLFIGIAFSVVVSRALAEDYPKMTLRYNDLAPEKGSRTSRCIPCL